ncbi:MAG: copper chaperone PCu(A)C [Ignavibacteria bacterium]|nr:copper chaperone PCu(A)C [Ignavibacteria bacterium]
MIKKKIFVFFALVNIICFAQMTNHQSQITIKEAWLRPAAVGSNTAFFFEVVNNSEKPDTLFKAESLLSELVEVHETYSKGNDMMGMRRVDFVEIPSNGSVKFKPRDLHIMLLRLKTDLKIGDSGKIKLFFKRNGIKEITGIVRDMPSMMKSK